jgi:hypothetical protein
MALTLGTNTYTTLAAFKAWLQERGLLDNPVTDGLLTVTLIEACDHIEGLPPQGWLGAKTTESQALQWPRTNAEKVRDAAAVDVYGGVYTGFYASDEYPAPLVAAQQREALAILRESPQWNPDARDIALDQQIGVTERKQGDASLKYGGRTYYGGSLISADAWRMLRCLRRTAPARVGGLG